MSPRWADLEEKRPSTGARARMRRAAAAVVAAGLVAVVAAGCGSSDDDGSTSTAAAGTSASTTSSAGKKANIAFFTAALQNTYTAAALDGMKQAAAPSGTSIQVFDANYDARKQAAQIQDAITSGKFDGFLILPVDPTIIPKVKEAIAQKIPVVSHDIPLGTDPSTVKPQVPGQNASVLRAVTDDGKTIGELIVEACADLDPCKVGILTGVPTLPFDKAKIDAVKSVLAEHPSIEVVGTAAGQYLSGPGRKAAQDLLQAHGDMNVLAANGDPMAIGAEQAIKAAGKSDQIKIVGAGATKPGVANVKAGRWVGTTTYLPTTEGRIAMGLLLDAVNGKKVVGVGVDPVTKSKIGAKITKETLAKDPSFTGEYNG